MASSSTGSMLRSSDQTFNGTKLMRLILDGGTEALRNVLRKIHPGNLQVVLSCTCGTSSACNYHVLSNLRSRRIISQNQWDKLYPVPPNQPNINDFDITLLSVLLRNICGFPPPCSGWDNMPSVLDHSVGADIVRIRLFRNDRFGHVSNTAVNTAEFKASWAEISLPLVRLGIDQIEIDRLENEECGEEETKRLLKQWNKCDNKILNVLNDIKDDVQALVEKGDESRSDGVLNKHLVWCDFEKEVELYNAKFTSGSREWVFEQLLTWFNDEVSEYRAFVISGVAGMGKSVIAAVICRRFAEHVGAFHFFQYNNSQYNNPIFLLQSLAWQLCKVVPAYKEALVEKLSGNFGQSLNNMNIDGLFSVLFKEPFSGIPHRRKPILVVLDAVDESEYHGKHELAFLISNHLSKLPSYIRFVITTRPEKNLLDKFIKLNPLYIETSDERNLNDIKLVLQERISCANAPSADLIDSLVRKSEGIMLYAFFLSEIYKDESCMHTVDSLPRGVEEYYERCFQRLDRELNLLGDTFLSFLSVLAVANEPLPEAFVAPAFGFENSPGSRQKVRKAINSISTFLVTNEDKSISFFHKSVRDWLVDYSEHDYSVDVQYGHKILFDLCVKNLDELKKTGVSHEGLASVAVKYALKYCIPHMLKGLEDAGKQQCFVSDYVADLEIMFASVCVNVDLTINNISSLTNHAMYNHVAENTRTSVSSLFHILKKFAFLLRDYPKTFFQNVINDGEEQLSLKASTLLEKRYKHIIYLKLDKKDRTNDALEARCLLSDIISGIDVSPKHDYVVCSYKQGGIELFSLATGISEWKIQDFMVELPPVPEEPDIVFGYFTYVLPHCIVFHPHESLILPGRLDKVLTLQGIFTTGPFQSDEGNSAFTNCCISSDGSKMVTNYGNCLIVWNLSTGTRARCLPCKTLHSFAFTASGNFLGTTDFENIFTVYDVVNDYKGNSERIDSETPLEIVSTCDENSWFCSVDQYLHVVNHDLAISVVLQHANIICHLNHLVLPCNVYSSRELLGFLHHPEQSWFSKLEQYLYLKYIMVGDKKVLVFSLTSKTMRVFSIEDLMNTAKQPRRVDEHILSIMSTNGDFVYLNYREYKTFSVRKLDLKDEYLKPYPESHKLDFLVVKDGVILYGDNYTSELWNIDLTQRVAIFEMLTGTNKFLSVSDELIACVYYEGCIKFFDVSASQVVYQIDFIKRDLLSVYACSIKYHVLAETKSAGISLWKDGKKVDDWTNAFYNNMSLSSLFNADFSPDGSKLAFFCITFEKIFIFDVVSLSFLNSISLSGLVPHSMFVTFRFFDEENLLCGLFNGILYFINVERAEILTCLDVGGLPATYSLCRKRSMVCVDLDCSDNFEVIKVCLARK